MTCITLGQPTLRCSMVAGEVVYAGQTNSNNDLLQPQSFRTGHDNYIHRLNVTNFGRALCIAPKEIV